jgi:hypothetical protein
MPKWLIQRTSTVYQCVVVEAETAEQAVEIGNDIEVGYYGDEEELSSEITCEGEASQGDIETLQTVTAADTI